MTSKAKRTKWRKGPPPSVGWWPTSANRNKGYFRWWDGVIWSAPAMANDSKKEVARLACVPSLYQEDIEWTDRPADWSARSRT
jgi:hypothetical protein